MSFGLGVGDALAVLGLFERIAIELRNYKSAPAHFQQLGAELDLLQSAIRHVLRVVPHTLHDRQTIERVRAIVMHCLPAVQTLMDKM
jgi:hypothetical protein